MAFRVQQLRRHLTSGVAPPAPTQVSLKGKVVVVTGGTGGIGRSVCKYMAEDGLHVIVVDIDESKCQELAASLPTRSMGIAIDISSPSSVKAGMAKVRAEFPNGVDVLVNVAGILSNNKIVETTAEEWRRVMAVNVDGAFFMTQAVVTDMLKNKWGRIVNMSSWGWKSGGLTAGTAYCTSKGAITSLTFSTARQYAHQNITANGVAPCYVMSPMVSKQLTAEQRAVLLEKIPTHRFCEPDEIAHVVRFLVHPMSAFITGEIIDVNAGFQMD